MINLTHGVTRLTIIKALVPGMGLNPNEADNRIPLLLIQCSLAEGLGSDSPNLHGWRLIIPKGWSMPFLTSLVYTGTRVGGQREREHQAFEAGMPYFPHDYPLCDAYRSFSETRAKEEKGKWERKPPAKRPNWDKLGTINPWIPDWGAILGFNSADLEGDLIPTQRDEEASRGGAQPWLLCGPEVRKIVDSAAGMFNPAAVVWDYVNKLRLKREMDALPRGSTHEEDLFQNALVRIKITLTGRGAPDDMAILYDVPDEEAIKWKRLELEQTQSLNSELDEETQEVSLQTHI
jgi:ribonuclease P/MRP protein subunit POP1